MTYNVFGGTLNLTQPAAWRYIGTPETSGDPSNLFSRVSWFHAAVYFVVSVIPFDINSRLTVTSNLSFAVVSIDSCRACDLSLLIGNYQCHGTRCCYGSLTCSCVVDNTTLVVVIAHNYKDQLTDKGASQASLLAIVISTLAYRHRRYRILPF